MFFRYLREHLLDALFVSNVDAEMPVIIDFQARRPAAAADDMVSLPGVVFREIGADALARAGDQENLIISGCRFHHVQFYLLATEFTENTEKSLIPSVPSVCSVAKNLHPFENRCRLFVITGRSSSAFHEQCGADEDHDDRRGPGFPLQRQLFIGLPPKQLRRA